MILDRLEHSMHYAPLGDGFAAGFAYLRETDLVNLADGNYDIDGTNVRAIVQTYSAKPQAEGRWEAHRNHADIQVVVSGAERMGVVPLEVMTVESPYDEERDVEFYRDHDGEFFEVKAGEFAVFFPHDVHMPCLAIAQPQTVKKVVIKVRLR
jgi:YhcH/YjgK/YiaL family protein